jgi:hypothetical protein
MDGSLMKLAFLNAIPQSATREEKRVAVRQGVVQAKADRFEVAEPD